MMCLASFSLDDYKGVAFMLAFVAYCTIYPSNKERFRHWYYISLAHLYGLCARFARTETFNVAVFFYLIAWDACLFTLHAVEPHLPARHRPNPVATTSIRETTPFNAQLRAWMNDDVEEAWKQKAEEREKELLKAQQERAALWALEWDEDDVGGSPAPAPSSAAGSRPTLRSSLFS